MSSITTVFRGIDEISPALAKINSQIGTVITSVEKLDAALKGVNTNGFTGVTSATDGAKKAVNDLGKESESTATKVSKIKSASEKLKTTGAIFSGVGKALSGIGAVGMGVTGALSVMTASSIKTAVSFDQLYQSSQIIFSRMLGGGEQAKALYTDLYNIATKSPFPIETFLQASKSLVGVGVSAQKTTKYMQAMTDAVAGFGGGAEQFNQLAFAFRRVATNGRVSMMEVNMMADDGINALQILGNHYNKTTEEMRDMIANEFVSADEALDIITDGIEKGSNGINGATQAMQGLAAAMKGKTITGAFDSMHTAVRNFALDLLGLDEREESGKQRVEQLTAAIMKINNIIEKSAPLFKGVTDAIGNFLTKLIGADPVFNETTGQWENTGGVLQKLADAIANTDPEKLKSVGNAIVRIGVAAPAIFGTGKALDAMGKAMEKVSRSKKAMEKLYDLFTKTPAMPDMPDAPDVKTPKTTTVAGPDTSPIQNALNKVKSFIPSFKQAGKETSDGLTESLNDGTEKGFNRFVEKIKAGFEKGRQKAQESSGSLKTAFSAITDKVLQARSYNKGNTPSMDLSPEISTGFKDDKGNFITKYFKGLNDKVNSEGLTFGQNFKNAITKNLPSGKGLGNKAKSVFSNFGKSSKELGNAGFSMVKALIPDNITEMVTEKLGTVSKAFQGFGSRFTGAVSKIFSGAGSKIAQGIGFLVENFQSFMTAISPITSAIGGILAPITGFITSFVALAGSIVVVLSTLGFAVGLLGKFGEQLGGVQFVSNMFAGISQNIANFAANAVGGINAFFDDIKNNFPQYANIGGEMIAQFVVGIFTTIPQILTAGAQILITLVSGIITSLPSLVHAGFNAITSFISGVVNNLPNIANAWGQMFTTIGNTMAEHWPEIQQTGGELITQLGQGIARLIPVLWDSGIKIITWLKEGISNNLPSILASGGEMIGNLVAGIIGAIPQVMAGIGWIISSVVQFLIDNRGNIMTGAINMLWGILDALIQISLSIVTALGELAYNIIKGLVNGLGGNWAEVEQWFSDHFGWIVDTIKGIFGIASPSTVLADIGMNLVQGFIDGISGMAGAITDCISNVFGGILDFFNPNKEEQQPGYDKMVEQTAQQMEVLKQRITETYNQIIAATGELSNQLTTQTMQAFSTMTGQILMQLSVMAGQAVSILSGIPAQFSAVFNTLYTAVVGYMTTLKEQTIVQVATMMTGMQGPIGMLAGIFNGVFAQIVTNTLMLFSSITIVATTALTTLITTVSMQLTSLSTVFMTAFSSLVMTATMSLTALQMSTSLIVEMIKIDTITKFSEMQMAISGCFAGINETLTLTLSTMAITVMGIIGSMNAGLIASTQSFRVAYSATWDQLIAEVSVKVTALKDSVYATFLSLTVGAVAVLNSLKSSALVIFQSLCDEVFAVIAAFVESVKNKLSELPGHFRSVGETAMDELRTGIANKAQSVIDTTHELVKKLRSTFITGLGIHSPSRFMQYIGEMMAAGLMNGLSQKQMKAFAEAVINDMKSSFKAGKFDPNQLVDYLGTDTEKVIEYLVRTGDNTVSEAMGAQAGKPPIIQEAEKYIGYKSNGSSIFGAKYGNPGGAWCAYFVRSCAEATGVPFPASGYVPEIMSWAQANGRWTQTPVPGYAAIFGGGSHIELVADVNGGNVTCIGGNTGSPRGVYERVRNGATGYVALDGGHPIAQTLKDVIQQAYVERLMKMLGSGATVDPATLAKFIPGYNGTMNLDVTGSGLLNPGWFQAWQPPAAVARWAPQVLAVLAMLHQPASLLKGVLWAINGESSGDPNSTYLGDINVIYGGSKGLLQTITPNFEKWKNPSLPNNIYDPMQNIWVCLREMQDTYGGIAQLINRKIAVGHWFGYKVGTRDVPEDMLAMIHEGEAILPKTQNPYQSSGGDYLGEIGDKIGQQVLETAFDFNRLPEYEGINDDGLNYNSLSSGLVSDTTNVSTTSSNQPINVSVNISSINNQGDLNNAEDKIVRMITNAINRANKASGSVASV